MAKTIKVKVDVDSEQVTILNQDTLTLTQQYVSVFTYCYK